MADKNDGFSKITMELALESALNKRNQLFMLPLFSGFDLTQSDIDFVYGNTTSNSAEAMALTLRWISGRMNAAYRKEFMGEISAMRKAVDAAENRLAQAEAQSDKVAQRSRRDFWIGVGLSTIAIIISIIAIF